MFDGAMSRLILALFMIIPCAVWDIRKRSVPCAYVVSLFVCSMGLMLYERVLGMVSWWGIFGGWLPGIFLILVSFLTNEKVGYGDGGLLLAIGALTGLWGSIFMMTCSLFLSCFGAGVLLVTKKATWKSRMPFIPYMAAALFMYILLSYAKGEPG